MKRLGINKGRYHGEGLNVAEYLREFHAAALERGWTPEKWATISGFDLFAYHRAPANPQRAIYLSSGMHGDEPAGPVALRRLVELDQWPGDTRLILCPCINPTGLQNITRENADGADLNRDYRSIQSAETIAHTKWIDTLPRLDRALLLHEDWEADGYYVYEINPANVPSLASQIIEKVREMCPIQPTGKIDEIWDCIDGVIRPHLKPEDRPLWAETIYLIIHKTARSLTFEAPSDFPLPFRVEAHIRAVQAALGEK